MAGSTAKQQIVILGGGFAGVYTAMYLERLLRRRPEIELSLVSRENYFTFQPMLAEVVSGSIGILDTVSPLHRLLPRTRIHVREVEGVDLERRTVTLSPSFRPRSQTLLFDHLVLALGTVTDFRGMSGLFEHAMPFKNLADAIYLRNHLIRVLDEAAVERDPELRRQLLTFVIAGGGFSGTEVAAEMNDFIRGVARSSNSIAPDEIRVVLVHSGERILDRELRPRLGQYAQRLLEKRGIELRLRSRLQTATSDAAILAGGERIPTKTLVSTVPSSPNPLAELIDVPKDRGRFRVNRFLEVEGCPGVWAAGDCMTLPNEAGEGSCPPTAQYAVREARRLAGNIMARLDGRPLEPFRFAGLGKMGSLGHRSAVAELFNRIPLSGFPAWLIWRTVYWWKLPGADRKLKVALSWLLDLLIPPETVQLRTEPERAIRQLHFEPGEAVFQQGDLGDSLYIILTGEAEVVSCTEGEERVIAQLRAGEYFGEMALLNGSTRNATVRCATPMSVLSLRQRDFHALVTNMPELRGSIEKVMRQRLEETPVRLAAASGSETPAPHDHGA